MANLANVINFEDYPVDSLESDRGADFLQGIRDKLNIDGSCVLPKFITEEALSTMAEEAASLAELGYQGPTEATPYFFNYEIGEGMEVDENHPTVRKSKRNLKQVATDLIPSEHLLYKLYHSEMMTYFLGQVLGMEMFCNQDKYQSLNISVMEQGGCQQWHFDSGILVTTLLLQAPEGGGIFEYVPNIRSDENENFDRVRAVLDGDRSLVKQIELSEGCLSLFKGHYSLHRVTEVTGSRLRLQGILGYAPNPDHEGSLDSSILHYGPRIATLESKML